METTESKTEEKTNKTPILKVLVIVLLLAVVGIFFSVLKDKITGFVTQGNVEVNVQALSSLSVNSNVYFGNGTISNDPANLTSISTEEGDNYGEFNNCSVINGGINDTGRDCTGIEVENNGNVYINVTMDALNNVSGFFSSQTLTGADFTFAVLDGNRTKNETAMQIMGAGNEGIGPNNASCQINGNTGTSISPSGSHLDGSWMNWTTISTNPYAICSNLSFGDGNDTITVEFNLTFPADEPVGLKSNSFTFTGAQAD